MLNKPTIRALLTVLLLASPLSAQDPAMPVAAKPLFRDPIFDGAADPVVIWNRHENKWFMFYTNRRAKAPASETPGVTWVHGTHIGIAESSDGGANWKYRGIAEIDLGQPDQTHWAPDVIEHDGTYHMYLTFVPGIFTDWNHPRTVVHLTSKDLLKWKKESTLKLVNDKVIDACVFRLPEGTWRMWYNNERDQKSIYYADSKDLYTWEDKGKAIGDQPGEGPKVFRWKDRYWMIVDVWDGLGLYNSDDLLTWKRQPGNLLQQPGTGEEDRTRGHHADVVVSGDRAYVFYFTHPGRVQAHGDDSQYERRRSSIQVAELELKDGVVTCDRNKPVHINLQAK
jgi:hypothetical protein